MTPIDQIYRAYLAWQNQIKESCAKDLGDSWGLGAEEADKCEKKKLEFDEILTRNYFQQSDQ